eukprot:SAG22_NODE_5980_length_922_cov_1.042527_1_plen_242_part_10
MLSGGHDHVTQQARACFTGCTPWTPDTPSRSCLVDGIPGPACHGPRGPVDFWQSELCSGTSCVPGCTDTACPVPNGTFEPYTLNARAVSIVEAHNPAQPLYLHYTPHMVHSPLQRSPTMPSEFGNGSRCGCEERCTLQSMVSVLDSMLHNLTQALKARAMMDNLVLVFASDNGGGPKDGSNYPWKGGKGNFFEGGVRGVAFVWSKLLPAAFVGTPVTGVVHVADWWRTFCRLAAGPSAAKDC